MGITLSAIAVSLAFATPAEIAFTSDRGIFSLKADGSGRAPLVPLMRKMVRRGNERAMERLAGLLADQAQLEAA